MIRSRNHCPLIVLFIVLSFDVCVVSRSCCSLFRCSAFDPRTPGRWESSFEHFDLVFSATVSWRVSPLICDVMLAMATSSVVLCVLLNYSILTACCSHGFVLLSSAATGGQGQGHTGFKLGEAAKVYSLESKVLLNDVSSSDKSVGYLVSGDVHVGAVWEDQQGEKLLKFTVSGLFTSASLYFVFLRFYLETI